MTQCWANSRHKGSELLLLLAIADFADEQGTAFPAISTLAEKCRIQPRRVRYILRTLERSGELSIKQNKGPPPKFPNLYKITLPDGGLHSTAGVHSKVQRAALEGMRGLHCSATKPSLTVSNHPTVGFERFWRIYPDKRKGSKSACFRLWQDEGLDASVEQIISHVLVMRTNADWVKEDGEYVPAPLTYLRQQRWDGSELYDIADSRFEGGI